MSTLLAQILLPAFVAGVFAAATASYTARLWLRSERMLLEKQISERLDQWRRELASCDAEAAPPAPVRSIPNAASPPSATPRPAAPPRSARIPELPKEPLAGAFLYAGDPKAALRRQFIPVGSKLRIGRSSQCDIVFEEASTMSQVHAQIEIAGDQVWVADLNSRNGTFVNGERIKARTPVPDLATLSFGGLEARLVRI